MNQVKAKIYYLISTGEVLTITSECQGCVEETTKEQDMEIYEQLKTHSIDEVDFIALEYGTLAETFKNIKSYSVDVANKSFLPVYYTQEEIKANEDAFLKQQEQQQTIDNSTIVPDILKSLIV